MTALQGLSAGVSAGLSVVEVFEASNTRSSNFTCHFAAAILAASLQPYLLLRDDCTQSFKCSRSEALTALETATLTHPDPLT